MVGKATLEIYQFETLEQYFDYIVQSKDNGQMTQVKTLINDLSTQQKKDCLKYLLFSEWYMVEDIEDVCTIIIDSF